MQFAVNYSIRAAIYNQLGNCKKMLLEGNLVILYWKHNVNTEKDGE